MIYCHNYNHVIPCLHCHPHSYIRMVSEFSSNFLCYSRFQVEKNSTETCRIVKLEFIMTVWRELEKENKDFFEAYFQALSLQAFYGWVYTFRNRVMKGRISTGSE
ncbi:hypothetical protein Golob_021857 [Gossypium lobatum]|uniref:Uncharacterized protein n=1 Tax=Gossypium lobatum TaxID=34289 RepID=A0A7J8LEU4_9ROSI|nr:hypothetical protein [Gossypium lobatum]